MNYSILEVIYDSSKDLYLAGVMQGVVFHKFEKLCLPSEKELSKQSVFLPSLMQKTYDRK